MTSNDATEPDTNERPARKRRSDGRKASVTIKDVASRLGVSFATVSRALNDHPSTSEETRARVREAAAALNYVPHTAARMMQTRSSRLIGLVIPDLDIPVFAATASVLAESCTRAGYQVVLSISGRNPVRERDLVRSLRSIQAAGIIIAPCGDSLPETLALLRETPCLQLGMRNLQLDVPTVKADNWGGMAAAGRHLVQLGHRRIGYIGAPREVGTEDERYVGIVETLSQYGLALQEDALFLAPPLAASGQAAMSQLLRLPDPPTAVVIGSGGLVSGAIDMLIQTNTKVPDFLSVIAIGDSEWYRHWNGGLTAIKMPIQEIAESIVSQLMLQIGSDQPPTSTPFVITHQSSLILRGSTAPPRIG